MNFADRVRKRPRALVASLLGATALAAGVVIAAPSSAGKPATATQAADGPAEVQRAALSSAVPPSAEASALGATAAAAATDLTYNTVDACRALDSRQDGPVLNPGEGYFVKVTGFCGVPDDGSVRAVMVNIISVNATGTGYVRQAPYPFGSNLNATVLNYNKGLVSSNGIPLNVCDPTGATCDFDFEFYVFGGGSHIVIDVIGYFAV